MFSVGSGDPSVHETGGSGSTAARHPRFQRMESDSDESTRDAFKGIKVGENLVHLSTKDLINEIMDKDDEHISAWQKNQTRCVLVSPTQGDKPSKGTVHRSMNICIPIDAFECEPSKWSDLRHSTLREAARFRAVTFVLQALHNEKIGTNYASGPDTTFVYNGRVLKKVVPKVEVLVRKLYKQGPEFVPPTDITEEERRDMELNTAQLLDMPNIAGLRIFWFAQDPNFSFDEAFHEQIRMNRDHWEKMGFLPKNKDDEDKDGGENYGGGAQEGSGGSGGGSGRGGRGRRNGRGGRGGRRDFGEGTKKNIMPKNKTSNDISFTPDQYKHAYASILTPSDFAKFVVYPLTEQEKAKQVSEEVGNDFKIHISPDGHFLHASVWGTSEVNMESMCRMEAPGVWENTVCVEQRSTTRYIMENSDGELEYTFPCSRLVWEYDPRSFVYKSLKKESLPFVVNSMFDIEARRIMRKLEEMRDSSRRAEGEAGMEAEKEEEEEEEDAETLERKKEIEEDEELQAILRDLNENNSNILRVEKPRLDVPMELLSDNAIKHSHLHTTDRKGIELQKLREVAGEQRVQYEIMAPKRKVLEKIRLLYPSEYPAMLQLLRREGMRRFMKLFNLDADVSDVMKAMIAWYNNLRANGKESLALEINSVDPRKGRRINSLAWQYGMLEAVDKLSSQHMIFTEIMHSVFGVYRYFRVAREFGQTEILLNISLVAGAGAGKSMLGKLLTEKLIKGTIKSEDSASQLAAYGRWDLDSFYIHDELRSWMASKYDKVDAQGQQSINLAKTIMTSHEITHKYLDIIKKPGKPSERVTVVLTRENNTASLQNTNHKDMGSEQALWNRFRVHNIGISQNRFRPVFSLILAKTDVEDLNAKDAHTMWASTCQFLHMCVNKMIVTGALPPPNISMFHIYYDAVMRELARYDPAIIKHIRSAEKPMARAYTMCIDVAIDRFFFSEDSPYRRYDPKTGKMLSMHPFQLTHLQELAPLMVLDEETTIKLVTEYMDEQFPRMEHEIVTWIARKKCNYIPVIREWMRPNVRKVVEPYGGENLSLYKDRQGELYRDSNVVPSNTAYLKDPKNHNKILDKNVLILENMSLQTLAQIVATEKKSGTSLETNVVFNILKALCNRNITFMEQGKPVISENPDPQDATKSDGGNKQGQNDGASPASLDASAEGRGAGQTVVKGTSIVHPEQEKSKPIIWEEDMPGDTSRSRKRVMITTRFVDRCPMWQEEIALGVMMHAFTRDWGPMKIGFEKDDKLETELKERALRNMAIKELDRNRLGKDKYDEIKEKRRAKKARVQLLGSAGSGKALAFVPAKSYRIDGCNNSAAADAEGVEKVKDDLYLEQEVPVSRVFKGKGRAEEGEENRTNTKKRKWNPKYAPISGAEFDEEIIQAKMKEIKAHMPKIMDVVKPYSQQRTHYPRYAPIGRMDPSCPHIVMMRQVVRNPSYKIIIPNVVHVNKFMEYMMSNKNTKDEADSWKLSECRKGKLLRFFYDVERQVWFSHLKSLCIPEDDWESFLPESSDNRIALVQKNTALNFKRVNYPEDLLVSNYKFENAVTNVTKGLVNAMEEECKELRSLNDVTVPETDVNDLKQGSLFPAEGTSDGNTSSSTEATKHKKRPSLGKCIIMPRVHTVPLSPSSSTSSQRQEEQRSPARTATTSTAAIHPAHFLQQKQQLDKQQVQEMLKTEKNLDPKVTQAIMSVLESKMTSSNIQASQTQTTSTQSGSAFAAVKAFTSKHK